MTWLPRTRGSSASTSTLVVALVWVIALASRAAAAFVLPNAEQDGYSYAEVIERLTKQLETGQFHLSDLYGFWLPGFQAASALVNLVVHEPLLVGKIVNGLCGAVSIVLVFLIGRVVTGSVLFSLLASGLMLLDPLHVVYSAACMTDVPHATIVLASLWFAVRRHWLGAALFAAAAESIRIESWALIAAIPMLQWLQERRIAFPVYLILLVSPLSWFVLALIATGSPLAYFAERARYHAEYMHFHPARLGFEWPAVKKDIGFLLLGAGQIVSTGALVTTAVAIVRSIRTRRFDQGAVLAPMIYGAAILGLLVLAYVTKNQPVWLPRYGLIFLAVGLPLFAWALQWSASLATARSLKALIIIGVLTGSLLEMSKQQLPTLWKVQDDFRAHQYIAITLVAKLKTEPADARCFSDDVAVRVLSRLPSNTFLRSAFVPAAAAANRQNFSSWLHSQGGQWLVFFPTEDSIPAKFFPELSLTGANAPNLELVAFAQSSFGPDIWLYRVR